METKIAVPIIGAMRGRNPENPNERGKSNGNYKQRLECNQQGTSNTLTGVQKDNIVIEPINTTEDGLATTLTTAHHYSGNIVNPQRGQTEMGVAEKSEQSFRIRKLTPRECFRLMGCDESTIDTLESAGISNSQLYKLAGNSIVVDVLAAIFDKMFVNTKAEKHQQMLLF